MNSRSLSVVAKRLATGLAAVLCVSLAQPLTAAQADPVPLDLPDPIASFTFDDAETGFTSGTGADTARAVVTGTAQYAQSWDGTQAASLPGSSSFFMRVYKGESGTSSTLLSGLTEMTVSYDVVASTTGNTGWTFFAAPATGNQPRCATTTGSECYVGILDRPGTVTAERFANGRANGTRNATAAYSGTGWKHVDLVITPEVTKLYINGALQGQSTATTMPALSASVGVTDTYVYIGRANWSTAGEYFAGLLDNYTIYGSALTDEQIAASNVARDFDSLDSLTIPNANGIYQDITLPATSTFGSPITWTSSDPAHLTAEGVVTRPSEEEPNVEVELTATISDGTETKSRTITVTVLSLAEPDPEITVANICRTENLSIWATFYTLTTSSAYYYPRRTCDGNNNTFWRNQNTTNPVDSLYYEFQDSYLLDQVSVRPSGNVPTSVEVLYRDAVTLQWQPVPNPSISPALASNVDSVVTFDQVHASGIQLKMAFTNYAQIAEVVLGPAVVPAPDAETRAQDDLDHIVIPDADGLRSNIELSAAGKLFGSAITWESSDPAVITDQDADGKAAGVVTRGATDEQVTLTATATSTHRGQTRTATKTFTVTVKQANTLAPTTDYLFAFFTGNESNFTDEQIYFSTSQDGKHYTDLTAAGNPVLRNTLGDRGVRDPHLVRAPGGDKIYMIGTDLLEYARNRWGANNMSTTYGYASTYLVVWETTDLVHWSDPWLVDVAAPIGDAGMAWAPEAFWDEASGQFLVFWASNTSLQNSSGHTFNQMMATTRDFRTFSEPFTWIDRAEENIDTTMIKVGDWYYRASKVGGNSTNGNIMLERSKNVLAPTLNTKTSGSDDEWVRFTDLRTIFNSNNYTAGQLEGPEFFKFNSDDYPEDTWALIADRYAAGTGYLPFLTTDLGATTAPPWQIDTDVSYGMKTRHGAVLPITTAEYDAIMAHYFGPPDTVDNERALADCTGAIQSDLSDVRGNLTLPTVGSQWGSTIFWQSSAPGVISTSGWVTRPATGSSPVTVQLTATATQNEAVESCNFDVTVTPLPEEKVFDHYLFASFHGGSDGGRNGEQIWLSASKGNDPFNWYELNYDEGTSTSQPILQTVNPPQGETGLRDPSLIRSPDGDRFYLLATDLKTFEDGQSWNYRQSRGSRNLVVYESDDLVNWSEARFVKVEDDHAGNVWAPEAFYDANLGQYIVFWASNLYPDDNISTRNTSQISYNRIRISTTRDFVTFTEPTTWINLDRSTQQNGWGMIDSTMIATDDKIYRLTKDENGFRVLLQYIDSLDDLYDTYGEEETTPHVTNRNPITPLTTNPNAWTMVGNANGSSKWQIPGLSGGNLEGPLVFKDNTEDMWYVFIDYASGGGYVAWRSDSMDKAPNEWEYLGQSWCNITGRSTACTAESPTSPLWSLPVSPRHGSVIPITSQEWEAVMTGFNSPVHLDIAVVEEDGTVVEDGGWVNEVPELKVNWTDFNGTGLAPAWLQLIEGHNGGPRTISPDRITTGIVQGVTVPLNAVEGENWAQIEYRDVSLGGEVVRLWTPDVSYNLDTVAPATTAVVSDDDPAIVTLTATDAEGGSGVATTEYRIGTQAWSVYTEPVSVPRTASEQTIEFRSTDNAGNVEETTSAAIAAAAQATFSDVPVGHRFFTEIEWAVATGVTTGYSDGTFRPAASINRDAVAAMLFRALNPGAAKPVCAPGQRPFSDVPSDYPFCGEIAWVKEQGITTGYADGTFKPAWAINRDAMAAFMARAYGPETLPACSGERPFSDVQVGHPFCAEIQWLKAEGITTGYEDGTFQPALPIERQAFVAFLYRAQP